MELTFTFTGDAKDAIRQIEGELGLTNEADVIHRCLCLMKLALKNCDGDHRLVIIAPDGSQKNLILKG